MSRSSLPVHDVALVFDEDQVVNMTFYSVADGAESSAPSASNVTKSASGQSKTGNACSTIDDVLVQELDEGGKLALNLSFIEFWCFAAQI